MSKRIKKRRRPGRARREGPSVRVMTRGWALEELRRIGITDVRATGDELRQLGALALGLREAAERGDLEQATEVARRIHVQLHGRPETPKAKSAFARFLAGLLALVGLSPDKARQSVDNGQHARYR